MIRKIIHVVAGLTLICSPLIASAQTATASSSSNASLIAALTQLVQTLEQELQQLIAARAGSTAPNNLVLRQCPTYSQPVCTNGTLVPQGKDVNGCYLPPTCVSTSASFTATPTSGTAPLTVAFSNLPTSAAEEDINFGDGQEASNGATGYWPANGIVHTYTAPGAYRATVIGEMSNGQMGQVTITVIGGNSSQPSATKWTLNMLPVPGSSMTTVPRTMEVFATYPIASCSTNPNNNNSYSVNFGDGTTEPLTYQSVACAVESGSAEAEWIGANHTYTMSGRYTATLEDPSGITLTTQSVTIVGTNPVSVPSSATVTSPTTQSSGNFSVFGTAQNSSAVTVTLISADSLGNTYSGATDWNTIGGFLQGSTTAEAKGDNNVLYSYTSAVTGNHQFSTYFRNIPSGTYTVLVHDDSDYTQYALLTQNTLLVTPHALQR